MGHWCGKNPECPKKTHVSKRATTKAFHIQPLSIMGIELGSQRWQASALSTGLLGYLILEVDLIEMCIFRISRYLSHNCYFKNTFFYDMFHNYIFAPKLNDVNNFTILLIFKVQSRLIKDEMIKKIPRHDSKWSTPNIHQTKSDKACFSLCVVTIHLSTWC